MNQNLKIASKKHACRQISQSKETNRNAVLNFDLSLAQPSGSAKLDNSCNHYINYDLSKILFQAGELLRHSHLQPYVLKIHMKLESPRHHILPVQRTGLKYVTKTRFVKPETVPGLTDGERRSFYSDRALNPSISGAELDTPRLSLGAQDIMSSLRINFSEPSVGSTVDDIGIRMSAITRFPAAGRTPRSSSRKTSATTRAQSNPLRISNPGSTRELVNLFFFCLRISALKLEFYSET